MTTVALKMPQLATGQAQPAVTVNDALAIADAALGGETTVPVESDADLLISTEGIPAPWQYAVISVVDDAVLTGPVDVVWPDVTRRGFFLFRNQTAQTVTVKRAGQSGVAIPAGNVSILRDDGSDIVAPNTAAAPGSDNVVNESGVSGSSVSDALEALAAALESSPSAMQTQECIAGYIATAANKDYKVVVKMPHGFTITETTTISESGTCTATFGINTTALGGAANSVSSTEQSQAHASSNVGVAGDDVVCTVSDNSSCAGLSFSIKYTRALE